MEQSFFQRHRKVFILIGVIIGIILAVTGFIAVAIVLILVIIGAKQIISKGKKGDNGELLKESVDRSIGDI